MNKTLCSLFSVLTIGLCCFSPAFAQANYAEGEALIRFKSGVTAAKAKQILKTYALELKSEYPSLSLARGKAFFHVASSSFTTEQIVARLGVLGSVLTVEPNYTRDLYRTIPNDPKFGQLWGQDNDGSAGGTPDADIDAPEAWDVNIGGSSDVVVAVIDTGVDYLHEDLAANMWMNPGEIAGNGIDDDLNGFVDDVYGFDFGGTLFGANDSDPMDIDGHGTHCAGTIAAVGNNGIGVVGVNWDAQIMALKIARPGALILSSDLLEAYDYMVLMKNAGVNIVAANASYGGSSSSQIEFDALSAVGDADIVFVAAAGNDNANNDNVASFPANYEIPTLLSVAATDFNDERAIFSNFGVQSVDIAAPGQDILSTYPTGTGSETSLTAGTTEYTASTFEFAASTDEDGVTGLAIDCGVGEVDDFPIEVSGNIALIQRGSISFSDKAINAAAAGAIGVIIYNNEPGGFSGTFGAAGDWLPAVSISEADGLNILAQGTPSTTITITLGNYEFLSGTSMATPQVVGAITLVADTYPSESAIERIQRVLGSVDPLPNLFSVVSTAGRLNVDAALAEVPTAASVTAFTDSISYSPGSSVQISAAVRNNSEISANVQLSATAVLPSSATISLGSLPLSLDAGEGYSNSFSISLPAFAPTGSYTILVEVKVGSSVIDSFPLDFDVL
ncbi:MAG: S8 family serine peptidase [Verrucomicrobiota bacterium]